jgi:hypothetical protein
MGRRLSLFLLLAVLVSTTALTCGSIPRLADWADESVGYPIADLEALENAPNSATNTWLDAKPFKTPLPDGGHVHVHPTRQNCAVHFTVNPAGIVTGWKAVGKGCRGQ